MTYPEAKPLEGQRILIVEDRYLIASELANEVEHLGGEVVGPVKDIASAEKLVAEKDIAVALLDVNLEGQPVFPLAEALERRGVAFVFLTGYDAESVPSRWRDRPLLNKPVQLKALRHELAKLARRGQRA